MNSPRSFWTIKRFCILVMLVLHFESTMQAVEKNIHGKSRDSGHAAPAVFSQLPVLISPENGAVEQVLDIDLLSFYLLQFSWYRYPDSVKAGGVVESPKIELQVGTDSTFDAGAIIDSVYSAKDTTPYARGLGFNKKYFWRIRPQFTGGNGPWSDTWSFTTSSSPRHYAEFVRTAPVNGASRYPMQIPRGGIPGLKLTWRSYPNRLNDDGSQDKAYYLLQLSTDSISVAMGTPPLQVFGFGDSLGHTLSGLKLDTKYYWRMRTGYTIGGSAWSDVWSFASGSPQATVQQIQIADSLSLHLADSLQSKSLPGYQQSRLKNYFYSAVVRCIAPPGVAAKGDLTMFVSDTGETAKAWHGIMAQIDPETDGSYADYTSLGYTHADYLNTREVFSRVHQGDLVSMAGFVIENPINGAMSNTVFLCMKLAVLDSSQQPIPPLQAALSDFYNARNIRYSLGEGYEGSLVELHNLTVYSVLDVQAGTFEMIDGSGNILAMTDLSRWFTLGSHRDPTSTYSPPHPGAHINTIRGEIVTTGGQYCIAPLVPGDIDAVLDPNHVLRGVVFSDENRDSLMNPGEAPIPDISLTLTGKAQLIVKTDANGMFNFPPLDSGTYSVKCQTPPYPWNSNPDIIGPTTVTFTDTPRTVILDFGFYRPWNSVSGKIFDDLNENGVWNDGEPGFPNRRVKITGITNDSTITDSLGNYSFVRVERGRSYLTTTIDPPWEQIYPRSWEQCIVSPETLGKSYSGVNFAVHQIPVRIKLLLTIRDDIGTRIQQMYWGNRGGATYGIWGADPKASVIDFSEQEVELPPASYAHSFHFFDARFQDYQTDSMQFGEGSWIDMRDFTSLVQADTHFVTFLPGYIEGGDYPMTIGWDKAAISASYSGDVLIVDPLGNKTDMKTSDSLVISDRTIGSALLIANGPKLPSSSRMAWHLVSVPAAPLTDNVNDVFQLAKSEPFVFDKTKGYTISKPMKPGYGYWLKCIPDKINALSLAPVPELPETVSLIKGWNIIGAANTPLSVAGIISDPPDIIGAVFSFKWIYETPDTLRPFEGYWVKASQAGTLLLGAAQTARKSSTGILDRSLKIILQDSRGNTRTLYIALSNETAIGKLDLSLFDLPPLPPKGAADIRFSSGRYLELAPSGTQTDYPVQITGDIDYPLTLEVQAASVPAELLVSATIGTTVYPLSIGVPVTINDAKTPLAIRVMNKQAGQLPKEYSLEQNYPNPFNPATTLKYALPVQSNVRLVVFNVLGQIVNVLIDEVQEAGYKEVAWNASDGASGVYFYRIEATPISGSQNPFIMVRKMILLK
jgi:hypothetical protein